MKPIPVTLQVQVPWTDVAKSVEAADLGRIFSHLVNQFVSFNLSSFFETRSVEHDTARRRAAVEIHENLSEGAKRLLAEVLALEFVCVTASQPEAQSEPESKPEDPALS